MNEIPSPKFSHKVAEPRKCSDLPWNVVIPRLDPQAFVSLTGLGALGGPASPLTLSHDAPNPIYPVAPGYSRLGVLQASPRPGCPKLQPSLCHFQPHHFLLPVPYLSEGPPPPGAHTRNLSVRIDASPPFIRPTDYHS